MKAYIHFNADPSVGCFPYGYNIEIPTFEEEYREEVREKIKALYNDLDGDFGVSYVIFDDENDNDY